MGNPGDDREDNDASWEDFMLLNRIWIYKRKTRQCQRKGITLPVFPLYTGKKTELTASDSDMPALLHYFMLFGCVKKQTLVNESIFWLCGSAASLPSRTKAEECNVSIHHTLCTGPGDAPHICFLPAFPVWSALFSLRLIFPSFIPAAWSRTWLPFVWFGTLPFHLFCPWKTLCPSLLENCRQRHRKKSWRSSSGVPPLDLDVSLALAEGHIVVHYYTNNIFFCLIQI